MIAVYVAGASRNRERSRRFIERVRNHPRMRITYDWIADVDAAAAAGPFDCDLDDEKRRHFADADLAGLAAADVAVFLAETTEAGRGMWVELGYAICIREAEADPCHSIVVSGGGRRSIFSALADVELVSLDDAANDAATFDVLEELASE